MFFTKVSKTEFQNVTPEDPEYSEKWYGVPPAGEGSEKKGKLILEILFVVFIEFLLWGIYRWATAPIYGNFGTTLFYVGHIIAAPTIHLGPILIYWVLYKKEKLFVKTDKEGRLFNSFLFGPFKMTRKFLLTAIIVGILGGVIWRVSEFLVSDLTAVVLGGSRFMTLTTYSQLTGEGWGVFLLMTFVMFFIVGPVEEFQFRSFVHDQSARVLPLWQALILSSVLFGLSHVPIAITVYKLPLIDLIFAEISWMTAGVVFGVLYMWSRNIFACIVMHGIGNWQLSVFFFQSDTAGAGLTHTQYLIQSLATSILANLIIIGVFYLVHRYYWQPQREGKMAFGGKLSKLQDFLYPHDTSDRSLASTASMGAGFTVSILVIIMALTMLFGSTDFSALAPQVQEEQMDSGGLEGLIQAEERRIEGGDLTVGNSDDYTMESQPGNVVVSVSATLTWADEDDIQRLRTFENQPDGFTLSLGSGDNQTSDSAVNSQGGEGEISLTFEVDERWIMENNETYLITATVTMDQAGNYMPVTGPGVIGFEDQGNSYSLTLEIIYMTDESENPEEDEI